MGRQKLYLFLVLIISVSTSQFAQITEITRLPVQNALQSIKESAPVWLSDNEIIIFYVNETKDSIFSTKSKDSGINWETSKFQFRVDSLLPSQELIYPTTLKTSGGRLIFAWSVIGEGIHLTYSDNDGTDWSQEQIILGTGSIPVFQKHLFNVKLSQLDDERIILCFNPANDQGTLYYKESLNDGVTWSDTAKKILSSGYRFTDHSINSLTVSSLICYFKLSRTLNSNTNIYARYSTDNGISWGDTVNLSGYGKNEIHPRISKDENNILWLAYVRTETFNFEFNAIYTVGDIFYKKSTDGGFTWSKEYQLTHYIGDDNNLTMNPSGFAPFVFYSTLKFSNKSQIAFGILDETSETYTPPALFDSYSIFSDDPDDILVRAYVKDDIEIESVEFYFEDSSVVFELYDDGMHDDRDAGDGIYANGVYYDISNFEEALYLNVNKLKIPFANNGLIAALQIQDTALTTFLLSDIENNSTLSSDSIIISLGALGQFEESYFLFSSGFFLSGYSNGTMWSNAVASSTLVEDYLPGTINSNPEDQKFNFYTIQKDDIPFGYTWQKWKDAVSLGAEFYDGDNNGIYDPVDKNWNGTWDLNEDMPILIGDVTAWCIYNDGVPKEQRRWEIDPQGIEIRQTVFATNQTSLENVVFIKYSILNTGLVADTLSDVFFGHWEDADVGDHTNDIVGCDTLLNSGFYYSDGPDALYGNDPPSYFTSILQGPAVFTNDQSDTAKINFGQLIGSEITTSAINQGMTSHSFFIGGDPYLSDPSSAVEARYYLEGKMLNGVYPNPCSFFYCEVRGGVSCSEVDPYFWASGDPVSNVGWINIMHVDHRNLVSTGPFQLEKDKPQDIIIAYVMGRGTDHFNSITVARENVQRAIQEYESNFASMTYSSPPPTNPVTSYMLYQNYPNPFNPNTTIRYELPQDGIVTIEVFDILGQKVKTLVNEFQQADRYEVNFNANSIASGVYIYQLRVNDFITSKKMILIK